MENLFSSSSSIIEQIIDNTDDGVAVFEKVLDREGAIKDFKYVYANQAALHVIGMKKEAILGNTLLVLFPSHQNLGLIKSYIKVMETGEPFRTEIFYDNDGLHNWLLIKATRMEGRLLVNFNDITEYKNLIVQNNRSQNLYQTLIKSLPHADVVLIDKSLNTVLVTGKPFRAFGIESTVSEGTDLRDVFSKNGLDKISTILKNCFDNKPSRLEAEHDGHLLRVNFQPVKDENNSISWVLMVSEDISIFTATHNELRNKIYDLESANEGLEQFAYVASHDLQEPLRKIRAFGDRLQSKYSERLDDTARDYIDRMQKASTRMQRLIDDLLEYSRVGRMHDNKEFLDMNAVLQEVREVLDERISENGADIDLGTLPTIEANANLMKQLFLNLISNAIKFRKEDEPPKIQVWAETVNNEEDLDGIAHYNFYIKDNGIGFDPKYLDRIFDIFQRLHGRNKYPGTGIGLAICRKIAETHHGEIHATSQAGQGSTFIITLPKTQPNLIHEPQQA